MAQTIDKEINKYINLLNTDQKKSILGMLKSFTTKSENRISIKQYNLELATVEKEIENGEWIDHEEVKKISATW